MSLIKKKSFLFKIFLAALIVSNFIYSQENNREIQEDPFLNFLLPINLGIIAFDNDINENFIKNLSEKIIINPALQKKFNIYPYSTLTANQSILKIKNFKNLNEQLFKSLRTNLSIEFLITGTIIELTQVSFKLIRTIDGKYFFNEIFTGNKNEEIIDKIIQVLATGKYSVSPYGDMILVEGGVFQMGNKLNVDSSRIDLDEIPVHEITVKSFYIDKYEVTVEEYIKFCESSHKDKP